MGYNGPAPPGPPPGSSRLPPVLGGSGPLGRSGVSPVGTIAEAYRRDFLGREPQPPARGFWLGLLCGALWGDSE